MSYETRRRQAFTEDLKTNCVVYAASAAIFPLTLLLREMEGAMYWVAGSSVLLLLLALIVVRHVSKPMPCASCSFELKHSILLLGKEASEGFCPKCGNEII